MVVTYLVLFLLTGSVVLPLKAVIMNILSIGASFGALVWVFQLGHLSGLLNFTAAPLDPSVPVLLFCIVFGLSMDYEVLLISRIQEEYRRTGDTTQAVANGLEKSGRLINRRRRHHGGRLPRLRARRRGPDQVDWPGSGAGGRTGRHAGPGADRPGRDGGCWGGPTGGRRAASRAGTAASASKSRPHA